MKVKSSLPRKEAMEKKPTLCLRVEMWVTSSLSDLRSKGFQSKHGRSHSCSLEANAPQPCVQQRLLPKTTFQCIPTKCTATAFYMYRYMRYCCLLHVQLLLPHAACTTTACGMHNYYLLHTQLLPTTTFYLHNYCLLHAQLLPTTAIGGCSPL